MDRIAHSGAIESTETRAVNPQPDLRLRESWRNRWPAPVLVTMLFLLWEVGARTGAVSTLFFPAPTTILGTLWNMIASGELVRASGLTLARLLLGLFVGGGAGLLLGLAMGWSGRLRAALDPLVAAAHPIPKLALLPLVLILFGIGEASKVVLIALAAFFPMAINAMAGVRQIHPIHFEVAKNYGAPRSLILRRVVLPGSLPLVLAGVRLALNSALVVTIAVELLTAREGLGATIWLAWETLRTEELYAALVVIAVLGMVLNLLIHYLSTRLTPWQPDQNA